MSTRATAVFGVGNLDSPIFFCGEAPGADEETQGFVRGPCGAAFNQNYRAMGVSRDEVYIGNIMNWRPETGEEFGNRPPPMRRW
jgi:DNA polymerase